MYNYVTISNCLLHEKQYNDIRKHSKKCVEVHYVDRGGDRAVYGYTHDKKVSQEDHVIE